MMATPFSNSADNLSPIEELKMEETTATDIVTRLAANARNDDGRRTNPVSLYRVFTYVSQTGKGIPGREGYVVPPFASHWGIIVGPDQEGDSFLHHLTLVDKVVAPNREQTRKVKFSRHLLERMPDSTQYIGETRLGRKALKDVGEQMITEFGDYHVVFWNCQTFAQCYLQVIVEKPKARFNHWTLADTTNVVMCAFLVSSPLATTSKIREDLRKRALIRKCEFGEDATDRLRNESDGAIDKTLTLAIEHPDTQEALAVMKEVEDKGTILAGFLKLLGLR
jgi:hypothetical protein